MEIPLYFYSIDFVIDLQMMAEKENGKITWLLDNGLGIDTPGRRSPVLMDGRQFLEFEFTREVVSTMIELLERIPLLWVRLVPEENDIPAVSRINRANVLAQNNPSVLVSVQGNAYGERRCFTFPRGIASFYAGESWASHRIAAVFQENLVQLTGWRDRGVRRDDSNFLKGVHMPAVLTRSGFYTNREQCEYLLDPDWRVRIAEAHVEAIVEIEAMGPDFFSA